MSSTSTSDVILELKGFNLNYNYSPFKNEGFKGLFISFLRSPLRTLMKRKKKITILNDINFSIHKGDRIALVGANGTGKTSLCRAITGMHGKQKDIKLNGAVRAIFDTSVVAQPELTGRENVEILVNITYPQLSKTERKVISQEVIEFSDIGDYIDAPFKHYSKGMKSRLFLSTVSARPTDLLILDEVFSGADQFFNEKVSERVKNMIAKSGAVIFISHEANLLKDICNKALLLHDGALRSHGDVVDILEEYEGLHK